jgi:heterodisulfide reductase subunit A-like polyferredoxin
LLYDLKRPGYRFCLLKKSVRLVTETAKTHKAFPEAAFSLCRLAAEVRDVLTEMVKHEREGKTISGAAKLLRIQGQPSYIVFDLLALDGAT